MMAALRYVVFEGGFGDVMIQRDQDQHLVKTKQSVVLGQQTYHQTIARDVMGNPKLEN